MRRIAFMVAAAAMWCGADNRPWEFIKANRTVDDYPPLVDFESAADWTHASRSQERQCFGDWTLKIAYSNEPSFRVVPPRPIPLPKDYDCASMWVWFDHFGRGANRDPSTPTARLALSFTRADGSSTNVPFARVDWRNWFLQYCRLPPGLAAFDGFVISGGTQATERVMHFDNFAVFKERMPPIHFKPRARRNLNMLPGANPGLNTGTGRLPFPTRETTILPDSEPDARLVWRHEPKTGRWDDFTCSWEGSAPFHPLAGGGAMSIVGAVGAVESVKSAKLVRSWTDGPWSVVRWEYSSATGRAVADTRFRVSGKSLVIDTLAVSGQIAKLAQGHADGIGPSKTIQIPYYIWGNRPKLLAFAPSSGKTPCLFQLGLFDWYRTNGSRIESVRGNTSIGNEQGIVYVPDTAGRYNKLAERHVCTISPVFAEVLPSIPNPQSPWKHVTGRKLWRVHAANDPAEDLFFWKEVQRYGMREVVICDHETQWRDGGESFTCCTDAAPGKGGDSWLKEYSRRLREELGYVYGPYNNFTDFAAINRNWSPDRVGRLPDGRMQPAWMRCYALRPAWAPEACETFAPVLKRKFGFNTAYCDVHTAAAFWDRTDYDARVPGAATMSSTYYLWGETLLLQKKFWEGPVYSEGARQMFFVGITDGNYAQDWSYDFSERPWLVDFDLLKMHDLECCFGMGSVPMFARPKTPLERSFYIPHAPTPKDREVLVDRFIACTLAYGHTGFLVLDWCFDPLSKAFGRAYGPPSELKMEKGIHFGMRSYYMVQQPAARFTQASAKSIEYFAADGRAVGSSEALLTDAYMRSQIHVAYSDGTHVVVNGSTTDRLRVAVGGVACDLPPSGYKVWTEDGEVSVESGDANGSTSRFDYVESPAYVYIDGRGAEAKGAKARGAGPAACLRHDDGRLEVISFKGCPCSFKIGGEWRDFTFKPGQETIWTR